MTADLLCRYFLKYYVFTLSYRFTRSENSRSWIKLSISYKLGYRRYIHSKSGTVDTMSLKSDIFGFCIRNIGEDLQVGSHYTPVFQRPISSFKFVILHRLPSQQRIWDNNFKVYHITVPTLEYKNLLSLIFWYIKITGFGLIFLFLTLTGKCIVRCAIWSNFDNSHAHRM